VTRDNIVKLSQPGTFSDPLTEVLRKGARALLAHAVEAEVAGFLGGHADKLTADGHRRLVRHGYLPEREIMTGIGPVAVRCPRVRDRAADDGERIRFSSAIFPPYARRSKSLEVLIPILYLKGISTGDFEEALAALLGKNAGGFSASAIHAPERGVGGRIRPLARSRSTGQAVGLRLGRWHLRPGSARRRRAVSAGDHRRHRRRQVGTGWRCRRYPRERVIPEGASPRSQAARSDDGAAARHRRRGARLLEGDR
jgi:Transposase, Mutator family